jgi:hypothetical protein
MVLCDVDANHSNGTRTVTRLQKIALVELALVPDAVQFQEVLGIEHYSVLQLEHLKPPYPSSAQRDQ